MKKLILCVVLAAFTLGVALPVETVAAPARNVFLAKKAKKKKKKPVKKKKKRRGKRKL